MSGRFSYAGRAGTAFPTPDMVEVLVGKSTEIHDGDVLVLTNASTYTSGVLVARPLLSGDTLTVSNGLIGVAPFDMQTNSSAAPINVTSPVTVDPRAGIITQVPNLGFVSRQDPVTGYTLITIWSFTAQNRFYAQTASSDVANYYLLNRNVGITASAATFPSNYFVDDDAAAANAPLIVTEISQSDPQFNSANGGGSVEVLCKPTFYAGLTGTFHAT